MSTFTSDALEELQVINLCDGKNLGCVVGFDLNIDTGCGCSASVTAIHVPAASGWAALFSFGRREIYRIPWCRIECVGRDTILVKLTETDLAACRCREGK